MAAGALIIQGQQKLDRECNSGIIPCKVGLARRFQFKL